MRCWPGNTKRVCGDFLEPVHPDQGRCFTYRWKLDCEAPIFTIFFPNEEQSYTDICPNGGIGYPITVTIPAGTIFSTISVADANAIALAQATVEAITMRSESPCIFVNEEQTASDICPDGTIGYPITVTIPAGSVTSLISVEDANAIALSEAEAQVAAERALSPCVPSLIPNVLWGWGRNFHGGIGVGNTTVQKYPVMVGYSSLDWVSVKAGAFFTIAIKTDGTLWSWGSNYEGELGQGNRSIFPSTANNLLFPKQVGTDTDWFRISAGQQFAAAVKTDGTLWTWGYNFAGQLGQGDNSDKLVPTKVGTDTDWQDVSCGTGYMMAIKTSGIVWCSGSNNSGNLGDGTTSDSNVFVQSGSGVFSSIFTAISVAGASGNFSLAIKPDGTLWLWGRDFITTGAITSPTIYDSSNWISVSSGEYAGDGFIVGVKSDHTLWSIGNNAVGQLGLGDVTYRSTFTKVGVSTDWSSVACGTIYTTVIKTDGTMWGCGADNEAELGQGGFSGARTSMVQMGSDNKWSYVTAGSDTTFALRTDTTIPVPPPVNNGVASGGIYTESGGFSIHTFASMDSITFYAVSTSIDYIVVGGGGAGGGIGGGGAGQFQKIIGATILAGTYPISVAQRAFRAFGGEDQGEDGGSASFNGITSIGGGGGGAVDQPPPGGLGTGRNGSSGGGGGTEKFSPFTGQPGGAGTVDNDGGSGFTGAIGGPGSGGGGGGVGSLGNDGSSLAGGDGGDGISDSISGTAIEYCAGGGGGGGTTGGSGGSSNSGGKGSDVTSPALPGRTPGSGGGGGYGDFWPIGIEDGDGAYGTVIIRYLTPP